MDPKIFESFQNHCNSSMDTLVMVPELSRRSSRWKLLGHVTLLIIVALTAGACVYLVTISNRLLAGIESRDSEFLLADLRRDFTFTYRQRQSQWTKFSFESVWNITTEDKINGLESEQEIYSAILDWTNADRESREQHLSQLLSQAVRWEFVPKDFKDQIVVGDQFVRQYLDFDLLYQQHSLECSTQRSRRDGDHVLIAFDDSAEEIKMLNPKTGSGNHWELIAYPKFIRTGAVLVVHRGFVFMIGCLIKSVSDKIPSRKVEIFDLSQPKLEDRLLETNGTYDLNEGRLGHCAVSLQDQIYVIGGVDQGQDGYGEIFNLHFSHRWQPWGVPLYLVSRKFHSCAALDGELWIFGGQTSLYPYQTDPSRYAEIYSPEAKMWTRFTVSSFKNPQRFGIAVNPDPNHSALYAVANSSIFALKGDSEVNKWSQLPVIGSIEGFNATSAVWLESAGKLFFISLDGFLHQFDPNSGILIKLNDKDFFNESSILKTIKLPTFI